MSTIFDEIRDVKRLIQDNNETIYKIREMPAVVLCDSKVNAVIHDRTIIIKGLELYLDALESTVSAHDRIERREKKSPYNGRDAKH